jgi:hypothetical protein
MPPDPAPRRRRLLVLAISSAAAGLLLWAGLALVRKPPPQPIRIERAKLPASLRPAGPRLLEDAFGQPPFPMRPEEWAFHLDPREAAIFFTFGETAAYDAWTYARPLRVEDQLLHWPEHPAGKMRTNVNALGCREDHELSKPPRDLRVLVAGDSHTFGVCADDEVLTERLEVKLGARHPGRSVEVLNTASGGYTFFNYLGTWFRFRQFRPQVFVVIVFAGNDFAELLGPSLHFTGHPWPTEDPKRGKLRELAFQTRAPLMAQGLNSIETGHQWPQERENPVRDAVYLCREMQRAATAGGAQLVIAFLPSPFLLRWPDGRLPGESLIQKLGLEDEDFRREADQGAAFLAGLRAAGIQVVDLTPSLAAEPSPPFWRHDLHLSTRGHEVVSEALLPVVDRLLEP